MIDDCNLQSEHKCKSEVQKMLDRHDRVDDLEISNLENRQQEHCYMHRSSTYTVLFFANNHPENHARRRIQKY